MTVAGKKRFEAQQDQILSKWGVTANHKGTCVLVPLVWSALDLTALAKSFSYNTFSKIDDLHLVQNQSSLLCGRANLT